jgi:hypothetical protein
MRLGRKYFIKVVGCIFIKITAAYLEKEYIQSQELKGEGIVVFYFIEPQSKLSYCLINYV